MTLKSGTYSIGPDVGILTLSTFRAGMGAKVGHDLVLEATRWSGTAELDPDNPASSHVQVTVDPSSLELKSATGGVKPISAKDREDISKNINDKILQTKKYPEITFESTEVVGSPPQLSAQGNLTVVGQTRPASLDLAVEEGAGGTRIVATTTITQSDFGIKPFSAMLGALKVRDAVDLQVDITLPS